MKAKLGFNFFDVFVLIFCVLFGLICFYPLWYVVVVSVMPYEVFKDAGLVFLPSWPMNFDYYKAVFSNSIFQRAFFVSISVTALATTLCMLVTSSCAYAVSKAHIKGMKILNVLAVFTMFFSGGMIPTFMMFNEIKLLGSYWVLVLPYAFNVSYFVIMRNYFSYSASLELEEAARIDGANDVRVFFRIIIPLSKPMFAAIGLFVGVRMWNDYSTYMVYCQNPAYQPVMWALRRVLYESTFLLQTAQMGQDLLEVVIPPFSFRMTTIVCAMLPILLVYPFLQKHFAKGILIGAVKG